METIKLDWNETDALVAFEHFRDEDVSFLTQEDIERFGFFAKRIMEKDLENGSLELSIEDKSIIVDQAPEYTFKPKESFIPKYIEKLFSDKYTNTLSDRVLIIVDPQNDFINGSLAVEGAEERMDALVKSIKNDDYHKIFVTLDWHPEKHCSFIEQGGEWPPHCIRGTVGSQVYAPLAEALHDKYNITHTLRKGLDNEEYSAFCGRNTKLFYRELFKKSKSREIMLCGIMGRVCVLNTLKDLIDMNIPQTIIVNLDFTADDDDNETIIKYCEENNIKYIKS